MYRVLSKNPLAIFKVSNLGMAVIYALAIWNIDALNSFDTTIIGSLPIIMYSEFIMMHSGVLYGSLTSNKLSGLFVKKQARRSKVYAVVGLTIIYLIFILAISHMAGSLFPLFAFVFLTIGRIVDVFKNEGNGISFKKKSINSILVWAFTLIFVKFVILDWGTENMYPRLNFGGEFEFRYYLIWGFLYFSTLILLDLYLYSKKLFRN